MLLMPQVVRGWGVFVGGTKFKSQRGKNLLIKTKIKDMPKSIGNLIRKNFG